MLILFGGLGKEVSEVKKLLYFHIFQIGLHDHPSTTSTSCNSHIAPLPPIGSKPRHLSGSGLTNGGLMLGKNSLHALLSGAGSYQRAPGSEREDRIELVQDTPLETKRKSSGLFIGSTTANNYLGSSSPRVSLGGPHVTSYVSTVSPLAPPFYPTSDTVESVVGKLLNRF